MADNIKNSGNRNTRSGRSSGNPASGTRGQGHTASSGRSSSIPRTGTGSKKRAYVENARDRAKSARTARSGSSSGTRSTGAGRSGGPGSSGRTAAGRGRQEADYEQLHLRLEEDDSLKDEITVILILLVCILLVLSYLNLCGSFGGFVNGVVFGLMGWFGYAFPIVTAFIAFFAIANKRNRSIVSKVLLFAGMMVFVSSLVQLAAGGFDETITLKEYYTNSLPGYLGEHKTYGGFFGGLVCRLLCPYVGNAAAAVIMSAAVIILFLLIIGKALFTAIARRGIETAEELRNRRREEEERGDDYEYEDDIVEEPVKPRERRTPAKTGEDDFPELEEFEENPVPRKAPKKKNGGFIDSLMRKGMALGEERMADTPEYKSMREAYGLTDDEVEEIENREKLENSGSDEDSTGSVTEGGNNFDTGEDFISNEIAKKFSSNPGIDIVKLHDHPKVTKTENTSLYMVDEEEDPLGAADTISLEERRKGSGTSKSGMNPYNLEKGFDIRSESSRSLRGQADQDVKTGQDVKTDPDLKADDGIEQNADSDEMKSFSQDTEEKSKKSGKTPNNGAASFTTPEQLAKLREEQENKPEPPYVFPPISLLTKGQGQNRNSSNSQELKETVKKLQQTFESFGVGVTVTEATVGPTVTRYELLPDQGVKVKTITSLADDIKLALAAAEIRIEAPIPGKAAVGIEVPNATTSPVLLRDLLDTPEFKDAQSKLTFAVGKDIGGKSICFDIGSMPHMLIAGATGSGKSVCINALILSILYKAKPSEVKLVMIDPKRVELIGYNGIPHLLVPVVTDVKKATGALNWAIAEMDDRYERFAQAGVNNLKSYNRLVEEKYYEEGNEGECPDRLPQILIIVDELNDLMMTANSKEVEGAICRLTQLARASGIHVVLATQRPSVNVITGTIKANIPSRVAFSVSSIVDSRTILDQAGAEKLLGKGDMLFYPQGYPKPVRLQGAFVSDKEISSVVDFIKSKCKEVKYSDKVSAHIEKNAAADPKAGGSPSQGASASSGETDDGHDEFFEQAGRFIIEKQKASIGMLQRVYKIGFNRAARIMDQLAEEGVVGPEEGTKPRRILMTLQQFDAYIAEGKTEGGGDEIV